jgi:hypothetical protein
MAVNEACRTVPKVSKVGDCFWVTWKFCTSLKVKFWRMMILMRNPVWKRTPMRVYHSARLPRESWFGHKVFSSRSTLISPESPLCLCGDEPP